MSKPVIKITGLTKSFKNFTAVKNFNLSVEKGKIYALLGPNGAGKTTTLRLILGILKPDAGEIRLFGEEYTENKLRLHTRIGVCPERHEKNIWGNITGRQYLDFFSDIYQVKDKKCTIDRYLDRFGLKKFENRSLTKYSRGMIQKLSLIRSLIHDPELIILDEPISGLDPFGVKEVRDIILERKASGATIFICSHLLSEVEKICDKIAIINRGQLLAEDALADIYKRLESNMDLEIEVEKTSDPFSTILLKEDFINSVKTNKNKYYLNINKDRNNLKRISSIFYENNQFILSMNKKEISLEDAFITITKDNLNLFTTEGNRYDS